MLWVLERTVSLRWLFLAPKSHVSTGGKDINFMFIFVVYLGLCQYLCCNVNLLYVMLLLNCKGRFFFFYRCALLCVHSSFVIISGCFALFVLLVSHYCCVALPHNVMGLAAVCDCGIS